VGFDFLGTLIMAKTIYTAYLTGIAGTSVGLFLIGDGVLAGADVGGLIYDGQMSPTVDGGLEGIVKFLVPAGTQLISGLTATQDQKFEVQVKLPAGFDDGKTVTRIDTPAGPVNASFVGIREV
jgi:hypothetical protein